MKKKYVFVIITCVILCVGIALTLLLVGNSSDNGDPTNADPGAQTTPSQTTPSSPLSTPSATPSSPAGPGGAQTPGGSDSSQTTSSLTKEDWNSKLLGEPFDNVSFELNVMMDGKSNYDMYLLADNKVATIRDGEVSIAPDGPTYTAQLKGVFINSIMAMFSTYEDFERQADGTYKSIKNPIVYEKNVMDIDVTFTVSDIVLTLTDKGQVSLITCHMKQEFTASEPTVLECDASFKFYDYGTTVIPESAETPSTGGSSGSSDIHNSTSPEH
jgi:hypothetical protein